MRPESNINIHSEDGPMPPPAPPRLDDVSDQLSETEFERHQNMHSDDFLEIPIPNIEHHQEINKLSSSLPTAAEKSDDEKSLLPSGSNFLHNIPIIKPAHELGAMAPGIIPPSHFTEATSSDSQQTEQQIATVAPTRTTENTTVESIDTVPNDLEEREEEEGERYALFITFLNIFVIYSLLILLIAF